MTTFQADPGLTPLTTEPSQPLICHVAVKDIINAVTKVHKRNHNVRAYHVLAGRRAVGDFELDELDVLRHPVDASVRRVGMHVGGDCNEVYTKSDRIEPRGHIRLTYIPT